MPLTLGPRLVVAGTHSGVGKTTVATGLAAALTRRGMRVATAKVGPDYIDPGYHTLATRRPARNLDAWLCGEGTIASLAGRGSEGAEVLVVEGVMGLFDGAGHPDDPTFASTAHVARLLDAPVVLVVDAAAMSTSVAALVSGFRSFDPRVRVAGVLLNRVGSEGHERLLREALAPSGVAVLGALPRDSELEWCDRHLGLVPVVEAAAPIRTALDRLATTVDAHVDLDAVLAIARTAPSRSVDGPPSARRVGNARVAVASGRAFSFTYPDNLEALAAAGAELVELDPLRDRSLPVDVDGIVIGGGFPEVYVRELAANEALLRDVRARITQGLVVWAECAGLLWLGETLDDVAMVGALPVHARMTERLTLGYRDATLRRASPLGPAGARLRGHEFHYSTLEPAGDALELAGRSTQTLAGYATPTLLASYLHVHLGGDPTPAEHFVTACMERRKAAQGRSM